jgi:ubiquinol-cytochrome c reductase iron-sulfur subunit
VADGDPRPADDLHRDRKAALGMKRLVRWLFWLIVLFRGLRHPPPERERIIEAPETHPGAELVVAGLLLGSAAAAVLAVVAYGLAWSTQAFGGALAGALILFAAALVVAAKTFIPTEQLAGEYPPVAHAGEQSDVARIVRESGDGITRKRLLGGAVGLAGSALGAALVVPAVSLGPVFDTSQLNESPWRRGVGLLDDKGRPWLADDIDDGTFYTALPAGADPKTFGAPLIVVRIDPAQLHLPSGREDWAPEGILAYSKICTHAGCAIALYRNPLFDPTEPRRAFVCPCHYSTFDPATGGEVIFGPAGRPLPQLPLMIGPERRLLAAGDFSGPPGPSWWGVRRA